MKGLYGELSETMDKIESDSQGDIDEIKKTLKSIQNRTEEMLYSVLSIEDRINTITKIVLELVLKEKKDGGMERSKDEG